MKNSSRAKNLLAGRIVGFIPFPNECEIRTASTPFGTWVAEYISHDDNRYAMNLKKLFLLQIIYSFVWFQVEEVCLVLLLPWHEMKSATRVRIPDETVFHYELKPLGKTRTQLFLTTGGVEYPNCATAAE